jgi:hypothetical protein
LFGTTPNGGTNGWGSVFELIAPVSLGGSWIEQTLASFGVNDPFPDCGVVADALYGITVDTGVGGGGFFTVYLLTL